MKKQIIFLLFIIITLFFFSPIIKAGYICDRYGGVGWIWYGGENLTCSYCGGDGCIENPSQENMWKDDCIYGCDN